MSVRRIPKNYLVVTGRANLHIAGKSQDFESLQEKAYLTLLAHDENVVRFDVQPVRIPVPGVSNGYVPDVLVHFKPKLKRPPELVEVKTREDLERNAEKYAGKFAAAHDYCAARGWIFKTVSQEDFPAQRLENYEFLHAYKRQRPKPVVLRKLLTWLQEQGGKSTVRELLNAHSDDSAEFASQFWTCVAYGRLGMNLDTPLGFDAVVMMGSPS